MSSKVRPPKSFRRILRGMPDAMRGELVKTMDAGGLDLETAMRARIAGTTRRRTGRLLAGLKRRVYPRSLRLRVGFLGTPAGRAKLFYARILEFGRKAKVVTVSRRKVGAPKRLVGGRKPSADIASVYHLRVRAMKPRKFVTGRYTELRTTFNRRLRGVWDRALKSIAGAGGND